ncbi:hypothetical protein ACP4OV_029250 [Aristida adscensionis]
MPKITPAKASKNIELQKQSAPNSTVTNGHNCMKDVINGEHPVNDAKCISTWVCKNLACKAVITPEDPICKRCSCFICRKFDDNKDPSLWLVCVSENGGKHCCGSSCHIECALQHKRVGCFDLAPNIHLDGSYSCASCGKVSGILGYWKRQLMIGKDARRVDLLCHRIYLSCRLLEGISRFKELHEIIEDAKTKLESEVGPLDRMSARMARGIVSRSSAGTDVQKLCSIAIQRADEWLSSPDHHLQDSLPAETSASDTIKGYKLWYWKSREQPSMGEPVTVPKDERKILVFNLAPCTEYSFRVISFTDDGILGHSESRCYTKSSEIVVKRSTVNAVGDAQIQTQRIDRSQSFKSTGFKIRNIWKSFKDSWAEEGCFEGFWEDTREGSCSKSVTDAEQPDNSEQEQLSGACRRLHFNTSSVPDLNVEATMHTDYTTGKYQYSKKRRFVRSNDSGGSETCAAGRRVELPAVESWTQGMVKQFNCMHVDACDQDGASAICREKKLPVATRQLGGDYEHCVKVIRQLECDGHIEDDFRMKFLTWYSLRSTDMERRAVTTFIKTLMGEPSSLAEQLLDSFGEIVNCKKPRTGFCTKLFH